jgi:hypothetical protein
MKRPARSKSFLTETPSIRLVSFVVFMHTLRIIFEKMHKNPHFDPPMCLNSTIVCVETIKTHDRLYVFKQLCYMRSEKND